MGFWDCPKPNIVFRDNKIPSRIANGGVSKFPHTLVNRLHQLRTEITFPSELRFALDSTESSLSLEFNRIEFLAKTWAEHWAWSRKFEEWFFLLFGTSIFGIGL